MVLVALALILITAVVGGSVLIHFGQTNDKDSLVYGGFGVVMVGFVFLALVLFVPSVGDAFFNFVG